MRYALPQPVTRHAEGDAEVTGPVPARRGVAVVAVVGGALSVAGASVATSTPHPGSSADLSAIGLAAHSKHVDEQGSAPVDTSSENRSGHDTSVLDPSALSKAVHRASEEGRKLADQKSHDSDSASSAVSGAAAALGDLGGGRTASMPGQLIDPEKWYLTLPTGKQGSPDTIQGAQLAGFHSQFFQLNPQHNGIEFSAGADGVTTKNSHYPRSELREMNGTQKASWSNTSGTHAIDVREAFTQLPNAKPQVVGVQIHDDKDDVLQIRLEGKTLKVTYANGKNEAVLDPNYQLGTPFDTKIVAADGKVNVSYNGQKNVVLPVSGSGWYWKVGAYVQSNGSKGDGASQSGAVTVFHANVTESGGSDSGSSTSSDSHD